MWFSLLSLACTVIVCVLWADDPHYAAGGLPVGGGPGSLLVLGIAVVSGFVGMTFAIFDRRRAFHLRVLSIYVALVPLLLVSGVLMLAAALSSTHD
jgi:hypothetical protein